MSGQAPDLARRLHQRGQLLEEQRVAAAAVEQLVLDLGVDVAAEQRADQLGGRPRVERVEAQQHRVVAARRPVCAAAPLGRAGRGDEGERLAAELGHDAGRAGRARAGRPSGGRRRLRISGPWWASPSRKARTERMSSLRALAGSMASSGVGSPNRCSRPSVTVCTSGDSGPTPSAATTARSACSRTSLAGGPAAAMPACVRHGPGDRAPHVGLAVGQAPAHQHDRAERRLGLGQQLLGEAALAHAALALDLGVERRAGG